MIWDDRRTTYGSQWIQAWQFITQGLKKRTKFSRLSTSRKRSRKFVSLKALLPEANPGSPLGDWPPRKSNPSTLWQILSFWGCEAARMVPKMCCPLLCSPGATLICHAGSMMGVLLISWHPWEFFHDLNLW